MIKEKLSLEHLALLYGRLKAVDTVISEYTFANLYLFREAHRYEVIQDRELFVAGRTYDGMDYIMPVFDVTAIDRAYLDEMIKLHGALFPVDEKWLSLFDKGRYNISSEMGDADYVYTTDKISTYPGKKLHKKRNLLSQFFDNYHHEAYPLLKARRDDAQKVLDLWQEEMGVPPEETDYYPCREALTLQEELILCGGIYYVDKEPAGFILGEEVKPSTFALHFAKGLRKVKGIYQYMYNNCAKVLDTHYDYVNFEQDLGKLPLRQAKSSYVPDMMVQKYRVCLRDE
ncbi:MAG TPA: DUF2156 domain-containing protein [Spirochaetes bacterium]|nr:DUF2156 domain-containing protein [Spirochaetota bacterium]